MGVGPVVDSHSSGRLTRNRDLHWVAAKAGNVVSKPPDGYALVAKTKVGGNTRSTGKAEDVETVVHRNHDDVFCMGEVLAVVEGAVGIADRETLSMLAVQQHKIG